MKDVIGYEGRYSITEDGLVWAHPNKSRSKGRWLKQCVSRCGYLYVCLFKDGKRKNRYVHQLVAEAFLVKNKPHVNHIDGNKTNNNLENLEYVTPKENKRHAFDIGITKMKPTQIEASRRNITAYNLSKKGLNHGKSSTH